MMESEDFDWCGYYKLGDSYIHNNNQAKLRTGISRFYYAAFCKSRNLLNRRKTYLNEKSRKIMTSKNADVHSETSRIFKNHEEYNREDIGKIISKELNKLRRMRNQADYDNIINEPLDNMLFESKIRSKRIIDLLNEID
ncbi:MAG: hypothetical protein IJL02_07135 [Methanobrevibacter sp.]|uniref:hypothetical protein n=1 Tax=Methanobrevibacter sp. TaxID=66852 RepID=UPI002600D204|nr:hypothetical protein [Methanobrevibacter sp.]MBQ6099620.1 hypothetical protein [Methanobrevibacter sp.]